MSDKGQVFTSKRLLLFQRINCLTKFHNLAKNAKAFQRIRDERSGQAKHLPCPREFTLHCCYTETKEQRAMSHGELQALSRASLHSQGFSSFSAFFRSSLVPSTMWNKLKTFEATHPFQANFVIPDLNPLLRFLLLLWFQKQLRRHGCHCCQRISVKPAEHALVSASSASSSCSLRTLACSSFTSKILLLSKEEALGSTTLENHHMFRPLLGWRSMISMVLNLCSFTRKQPVAPWPCHHTPGTVACTSADAMNRTIACSLSHFSTYATQQFTTSCHLVKLIDQL